MVIIFSILYTKKVLVENKLEVTYMDDEEGFFDEEIETIETPQSDRSSSKYKNIDELETYTIDRKSVV